MTRLKGTPQFHVRLLAYAAAGCASAIVGLYVIYVGRASSFTISVDGDHWATFADYLGGTLGPALSFLAFVAVLWTVALQREQLDLVRESRVLEEMQRLLSNLYDSIQNQLREDVSSRFPSENLRTSGLNLYKALIACSETISQQKQLGPNLAPDPLDAQLVAEGKTALSTPAVTLIHELSHFTRALDRYALLGGSDDVISYYVQRFRHIGKALKLLDITELPEGMVERFQLK